MGEYRIMKDNCNFEPSIGSLLARYPWNQDPGILQDNGNQALTFQKRLEVKQLKEGTFSEYAKCFKDMIDRRVISEITQQESDSWTGPINYNTHHDVLKDSVTTPVRLVSNSSYSNGQTALNEILVKGPNTLNSLYNNLIKFRGYYIAVVGDISKAYNSIKTGLIERHTRRYWFRFNSNDPWKCYGANVVMFGDRPAAGFMTIAVERAYESFPEIEKLGIYKSEHVRSDALKLLKDSYVDDITTGGSETDVNRMMGAKDIVSGQFSGTLAKLLGNVGLKLKCLVRSGSTDVEAIKKLSGTTLGYSWEPTSDVMGVKLKFNSSKKRKGIRINPNISLADLDCFRTTIKETYELWK